jgi:hypothetical protein
MRRSAPRQYDSEKGFYRTYGAGTGSTVAHICAITRAARSKTRTLHGGGPSNLPGYTDLHGTGCDTRGPRI